MDEQETSVGGTVGDELILKSEIGKGTPES
jgi:hypothetical protein